MQQPLSRSSLVTMDSRGSPAADAVAAEENRSTSIVLIASAILNLDIQIIPLGIDVMGCFEDFASLVAGACPPKR